jgi:hypothetical protein
VPCKHADWHKDFRGQSSKCSLCLRIVVCFFTIYLYDINFITGRSVLILSGVSMS